MDRENYQKLRDYALKLLSIRPRSQAEIKKKLLSFSIKWDISENLVEELILDLKRENLINDEEFALWWKDQRSRSNPKGKYAIKFELIQKGVEREIIDKVLSNRGDQEAEFEKAQKLAAKKLPRYRQLKKREIKTKLSNCLFRRGFDWDTVLRVVDSLLQKKYNMK